MLRSDLLFTRERIAQIVAFTRMRRCCHVGGAIRVLPGHSASAVSNTPVAAVAATPACRTSANDSETVRDFPRLYHHGWRAYGKGSIVGATEARRSDLIRIYKKNRGLELTGNCKILIGPQHSAQLDH